MNYLRVKNWATFQHYSKRRPPWIKLYNDLVGGDDAFGELDEEEQWQLVRIWLIASRSSRFALDEEGRQVPIVTANEPTLRRSIQTLRRIPLEKFVRDGWLIPAVALADCTHPCSAGASTDASNGASTDASALLETEKQRFREEEKTYRPVGESLGTVHSLGALQAAQRLYDAIPETGRDEGTQRIVLAASRELPAAVFDEIRVALDAKLAEDGLFKSAGAYVNGALQKALRGAA